MHIKKNKSSPEASIKILGFTLLRNGIKYYYPFRECLNVLTELCDNSYIALGDSDDRTEQEVSKVKSLNPIPTVWDMSLMGDGGKILSQQTNIALEELRLKEKHQINAWGFYLQTDELIHEKDFDQIRKDIQLAHDSGCDAVRFRYYHFWLNHNEVAISKRWYPQEIRAIKLNTNIKSHGDAQGFTGYKKVYESDVHIYHYGHVRDKEKREAKQELLIRMIRPGEKFKKYKRREDKSFNQTETLPYLGSHPKWMIERIERFGDQFEASPVNEVSIYDPNSIIDDEFKNRINAKKINLLKERTPDSISLEPTLLQKLGLKKKFPSGMRSPIARPWTQKQRMEFLLWSHGVATK